MIKGISRGIITLSLLSAFSISQITACGSNTAVETAVSSESESSEITTSEAASAEESSDSSEPAPSWADAYYDYIMNLEKDLSELDYDGIEYRTFAYIYVNDDDIPELVIQGQDEATGNIILTYDNGKVDELQTARLNFDYIERKNLLCNNDGHMGYYFDAVYSINNGKWEEIAHGESYVNNNSIEWSDEDLKYEWNGEETSAAEYNENLRNVYDETAAVQALADLSYSDIKEDLLDVIIGKERDYLEDTTAIHKYEVFVEDVTWDEALEACKEKGGYLVRINSFIEEDHIEQMLTDNKQEKLVVWLGGCVNPKDKHYHWTDGEKYSLGRIDDNYYYNFFWLTGEPSFTGYDSDGNPAEENCMCMFRVNDFWEWNDVPSDISPFYPGRIAYICEYE